MNEAYELLKGYVPIRSALKTRRNDSMLIVANRNSEVYYLNEMAADIWAMIDGESSIEELSRKVLQEYDADSAQVNSDMTALIRDLQWKRLVRLKEGRKYHEKV